MPCIDGIDDLRNFCAHRDREAVWRLTRRSQRTRPNHHTLHQEEEVALPEGVEDIDAADQDDPQLVSAYVGEIMAYQRELEVKQSVAAAYMSGVQTDITPNMRTILVDW
jgi:hypothetical protein